MGPSSLQSDPQMLSEVLEQLRVGVGIYDAAGRLAYRNSSMDGLLADAALDREVRSLVDQLRGEIDLDSRDLPDADFSSEIGSGSSRYRLQGAWIPPQRPDGDGYLMVSVERARGSVPAPHVLRDRYGLTRQEARIAALLAAGRSNAEIAGKLFISEHTARNHTRRVLCKLGVRSRAQVRPRLQEG